MTCPHEQVGTFRIQDTGEVVMWACVECRQKFVPLDVAMEQDAKRYRWLLDNGPDVFAAAYYNTSTPEAVRAAIDSAMKE